VILRRIGLLAVLAAVASLQCRRAEGVTNDPVEREAEEALVAYLRIDTTTSETPGAVFLRELLVKNGVEARLVGDDPPRQGVYARLVSGSNEPALLLLSHIDVVPADPALWRHPPFSATREGGYIWGRGAVDDKSLTIAQLMSLLDLKRRGAKLRRDVVFLAVPDEERGGLQGAKLLLDEHPELFTNVGFVLTEGGTNRTAVDRVLFWGVEVQQKVPLWLRITAESTGGHGAAPRETRGASAKLISALAAVDAIQTTDSIAITHLSAGSRVNVVPSVAYGEVDIRLAPGSHPEAMLQRVRDAVGKNAEVEVILAGEPSPESPVNTELYETVNRVLRAEAPGSSVAPMVNPGTSDARFFRAKGMTAYGILPFKVNYYDADGVHGDDERIRGRFFGEGVGVMRRVVREFCESR
jgi:acetylornithine deacetylase/succinyl-diaminopimelate desuccinylase-like protein